MGNEASAAAAAGGGPEPADVESGGGRGVENGEDEAGATEETTLLGRVKGLLPGAGAAKSQAPPPAPTSWAWLSGKGANAARAATSSFSDTADVIATTQRDPCPCLQLTYPQRFTLFLVCFTMGSLLSFMSTMNVPLIAIRPAKFAIPFSLGNILSLGSMSFLIGFKKQCKSLFHPDRAMATTVFLVSILTTMWASFMIGSTGLTLVSVVVQYLAYIWYCASYIPYGRSFLLGCLRKMKTCFCV